MTKPKTLFAAILGSVAASPAHAHFTLTGDDSTAHVLASVYGVLVAALIAYIVFRKIRNSNVPPEHLALKRRLADLERALNSSVAQLRNAEKYPEECRLSAAERSECQKSAESLQVMIEDVKSQLSPS